ncbi:DUF1205 domain-containing protein [Streptomyces sp. BG9H]|uniref:DUF1205 domain-containing protein n=1 Tax=Streptomyces anatolicus TaxID=2675858 RepID=A0ABS6YUV3_9ACTN|nr:nucleotide disphospho-sugar-binding domain-containing protein [Streptomyces anatolicus]MBW5425189.1 DUF1205 domain-containing protein [Streptomyces anatolicus]
MRVLIITTPVPTHLTALAPLAWALRGAGHDVLVAGQPDVAPAARAAGLSCHVFGEPFAAHELLAVNLPEGARPIEAHGRPDAAALAGAVRPWIMHARYTAAAYAEFARSWRPDLILADRVDYGALITGGLLGVPVVQHRWGIDPIGESAWRIGQRTLGPLCARLGLPAGLPRPSLVLDPCPPGVQSPELTPGEPIRCVPSNGSGVLPAWAAAPPAGRRLLVTLGTISLELNGAPLLRTVLEACAGLPDTEVVAPVQAEHRADLGDIPAGVRVVDPVPLDLVLDHCAAVVHHGGTGTHLTATAFGLPQLVLPGLSDTFTVADRVVASGAGLSLDTADAQNDPAAVGAAVRRVLDDPSFAARAAELAESVRKMPAPAALVPALVDLARSGPRT